VLFGGGAIAESAAQALSSLQASQERPVVEVTGPEQIEEGGEAATLVIRRSGDVSQDLTVTFSVKGTARRGRDYELAVNDAPLDGKRVTIPAGQDHIDVAVRPAADGVAEPVETVILRLVAKPGYALTSASASRQVTTQILDGEPTATVRRVGEATEGGAGGGFVIERLGSLDSDLTVRFSLRGTAKSGVRRDYVLTVNGEPLVRREVVIPQGESSVEIRATAMDDERAEGLEAVNLVLRPGKAYHVTPQSHRQTATLFVVDNERFLRGLFGVDFGPYTKAGEDPDLTSLTPAQLEARMRPLAKHVQWFRKYGTERGLEYAGQVAHKLGCKIAMGAWLSQDLAANEVQIENLIAAAARDEVDMAIVGSETLERGDLSAAQLIAYIERVRTSIPDGIPVCTADTYNLLEVRTEVVDACDVVLVNIYPFWEGLDIDRAIGSLASMQSLLDEITQDKPVWLSEVGWPSAGNPVDDAVPSPRNAARYFSSLVSWAREKDVPCFYFEAYDEPWKGSSEGTVGSHWGLFHGSRLKSGMGSALRGKSNNEWRGKLVGGVGTPAIEFTQVPPVGSFEQVRGRVHHVWTGECVVAVYINVNGGWWTKPYWNRPATPIAANGTWAADITTGGIDERAREIAAYLLPITAPVPSAGGGSLPAALNELALARIHIRR
jgi:exo-beta-1,3-glucanase (GH17 family)